MIEKRFFHNFVFEDVLRHIGSLDKYGDNYINVKKLAIALHFAKKSISNFEMNIYDAINDNDLESLNLNYHSFIEHIYETLYCYPDSNRRRGNIFSSINNDYSNFEELDFGARLLLEMREKDIRSLVISIFKRTRVKITFYFRRGHYDLNPQDVLERVNTIIRLIVLDINDINEAWKEVEEYYRNRYLGEFYNTDREITFLSYSFKDKTYALFLFDYFYRNGAFLYVDNLLGEDHTNIRDPRQAAIAIKNSITDAMYNTQKFLLLRSVNDENETMIRPWCSFEIGLSHSIHRTDDCYYINVAINTKEDTLLYHDFHEFSDVYNGKIRHI